MGTGPTMEPYLPGRGRWVIKKAQGLGWRPTLHLVGAPAYHLPKWESGRHNLWQRGPAFARPPPISNAPKTHPKHECFTTYAPTKKIQTSFRQLQKPAGQLLRTKQNPCREDCLCPPPCEIWRKEQKRAVLYAPHSYAYAFDPPLHDATREQRR
ncbi:hypothetical protein Taro_034851 [Colocasia esculenta]|uniref:Uncharacterized protein n=1 Tax=Colocasia esculenta TaxID=4460 RepID=A0A843WD35_COLES|nr:hypothetical protein [Colocasia esculenta]